MASYSDWNDAIADFFTRRTLRGDMFHLAVDEDALSEIAESSALTIRQPNAVVDFERAVRTRGVRQGSVRLPSVRRSRKTNAPGCIAFLAAMSLAAHRMAPDDDIGENNYFTRLREILDLTDGSGRPEGMSPAGEEEKLWAALNKWALENGWRPSAERGDSVLMRYINYPLSQALLRDGDKGRLESAFRQAERRLTRYADRERVAAWFFNNDAGFSTNHLTNLAQDSERFDSVVDAVYDVYDSIDWDSPPDALGTTPGSAALSLHSFFAPGRARNDAIAPRALQDADGGLVQRIRPAFRLGFLPSVSETPRPEHIRAWRRPRRRGGTAASRW